MRERFVKGSTNKLASKNGLYIFSYTWGGMFSTSAPSPPGNRTEFWLNLNRGGRRDLISRPHNSNTDNAKYNTLVKVPINYHDRVLLDTRRSADACRLI